MTVHHFMCEHCGRTFDAHQACATYAWRCPSCSYSIVKRSIIDGNLGHPLFSAFPLSRGTTASELNQMMVAAEESADPDHYKQGDIECIDAMRAMLGEQQFIGYLRGTIFKYNWRFGLKDAAKVEQEKMAVYMKWLGETLDKKELSK